MKVYLSSTLNDLGPEREAVKEALGGECTVVESYVADERSVRDSCLADVAGCALYLGIVGMRYGFVPPGQAHSITELEYHEARAHGLPTLVFLKAIDRVTLPFSDAHTEENPRERIEAFRQALTSGTDEAARASIFKSPDDLKAQVLKAFLRRTTRQTAHPVKPIEGAPYPGLRAFRTSETDRFFGRDAEMDALLDRLLVRGDRFLALIGASGSGKSSLVYAGLLPRLGSGGLTGGVPWRTARFFPSDGGADPVQAVATALRPLLRDPVGPLVQRLRESPGDIAAVADEALADVPPAAQLLLFADQFEEVFAASVDAPARTAFFALLAAAAGSPRLRVVVAMRSDFYDRWPQDEAAVALLRTGHFPVAPPGAVALEKMITGPAQAAGLQFRPPGLAQRILHDTGTAPGSLALAEFALAQLYAKRDGRALTAAAYEAIGGVAGAIEGQAERAVQAAERDLARTGSPPLDDEAWSRLFRSIANIEVRGTEQAVVRRRCTPAELPGAAGALARHLVNERLLVSSGGTGSEPAALEVGHEAVFSHWQRFAAWHRDHAEQLALLRQAERAAAEWERAGHAAALRWVWERQEPALLALLGLEMRPPLTDPDLRQRGIDAWRALRDTLVEPLRAFLYPEPLHMLEEVRELSTPHRRREEIGMRLHQIGDPRRGVGLRSDGLPDIAWLPVAAGKVTVVTGDANVKTDKRLRFEVSAFEMARYPITYRQYCAFIDSPDGFRNPRWWQGLGCNDEHRSQPGDPKWAFNSHPVNRVSWYDAIAFCHWLSERLAEPIRLPTEWEWQWAAMSDEGGDYPWPGDWSASRSNCWEAGIGRTVAVGLYPSGRSHWGLDDMVGNVWEWCLNERDTPANAGLGGEAARVLRGGSWENFPQPSPVAFHGGSLPSERSSNIGFRVCRTPAILKRRSGRR